MLKEMLSMYSWQDCVKFFTKRGFTHVNPNNEKEHYLFLDRGSKVLAVAHLDHVMFAKPKKNKTYVNCPQLDDRLGLWVIYALLPTLGCKDFDILLTDHEESSASTAEYFIPTKEYNWAFEFDRMGSDDCALYQYDTNENKALVKKYGFDPVGGSFTDICDLNHLKCGAFNFAVGYHNQHSMQCYADLDDTVSCAKRFISLFDENQNNHIPHDGSKQSRWDYGYSFNDVHYTPYRNSYDYNSYQNDRTGVFEGYGPSSSYRKESDFLEGYEYDSETDLFVPKEEELIVCTNSGLCIICENYTDILGTNDLCGACSINYNVEIPKNINPDEFCFSCQQAKYDTNQGLCEFCRDYYEKADELEVIMVYEKLALTI